MAIGSIKDMRRRLFFTFSIFFVSCFLILSAKLISLQVIQSHFLERMALEQQLADTKLKAKRGTIYDRNFNPLAKSATVWNVVLEPNSINNENRDLICSGLSEILDIDVEKIRKLSLKKTFYNIVKKKIDCDVRNKIIEFKNKNKITNGIRLIEDNKRYYPFGSFASVTLGFVGSDGQGLAGLEAYYEKYLKGEDGRLVSAKNAIGTEMPYEYEQMIPSQEGYNLRLTIDSNVQRIVEKCLHEGIKINKVLNRGVVIVMDVKDGEILALAVKEDFDPNHPFEVFSESDKILIENAPENEKIKLKNEILSKQWRNKAISDTYYPGSVFKMIMAAIGFQLRLIDENSSFNCGGGIRISERSQYIRCHKRLGHGPQNFVKALCNSCNPAFISLGQKIGTEKFFEFYENFGFHERTGIDLPGEAGDIFFSTSGKMRPIDLAVASIGQNFSITAIQMICAACAIANGGNLVKPHLVKEIVDKNGNIIKSFDKTPKRNVISGEVASRILKMLELNAISGGAKNAYVPGFRIAGKTGTSEKIGLSTPGHKDYISSFCGFAPADDPKIAIIIILDTPRGSSYYGGLIVAPIFASIASYILPYLGIEKKYSEEEMKRYITSVPDFLTKKTYIARELAINSGLEPIILGKGENIISQMPSAGELISRGSTIILHTENSDSEKVRVPNFVGLSIKETKQLAKKMKFNIKIIGCYDEKLFPVASSQSVKPGEFLIIGSVIDVKFVSKESVGD
ncbi:MAG: stage V sporulation protein D [Candidatus Improbicoccus pseudotrichonymphae]|uniref:Stage V sporulation protein D n=1 Tax=Candidatus Improbicoccus pseudotrichonymphae TaxID=3033792 RepID=A0AA48KYW8_9FIRM|nr:MAG: stage V sporulation protein D [Candidatus Improbicoccus pseudotrichonymphae]